MELELIPKDTVDNDRMNGTNFNFLKLPFKDLKLM